MGLTIYVNPLPSRRFTSNISLWALFSLCVIRRNLHINKSHKHKIHSKYKTPSFGT